MLSFSGTEEPKGTLCLQVHGLKKIEGNIGILVFNREGGFPMTKEHAVLNKKVKVNALTLEIDLEDLPYGKYAIAIVHDINSNKVFDKNFLGIPTEPFGFSNNKSIFRGLPDFQEASIELNQKRIEAKIKLIHLF